MKCYKCGCGLESGRDFIPIEPKGTLNRKWTCTLCADLIQRQQAKKALGKEVLEVSRIFSPDFLKQEAMDE